MLIQRLWILGAAMALLSTTANAAVIDTFAEGEQAILIRGVGMDQYQVTGPVAAMNTVGQYRELQLAILAGSRTCVAEVVADPGSLNFTQGTNTLAQATVIWDGNNAHGLDFGSSLNANLTVGGESKLAIDVLGSTRNTTLTFTFYTGSLANYATASLVIPQLDGVDTKYLDFSSFITSGSGFSFSDVDAIQLVITGDAGGNISINSVQSAVPEPATLALLALGAPLAIGYRLLRRRAA